MHVEKKFLAGLGVLKKIGSVQEYFCFNKKEKLKV